MFNGGELQSSSNLRQGCLYCLENIVIQFLDFLTQRLEGEKNKKIENKVGIICFIYYETI